MLISDELDIEDEWAVLSPSPSPMAEEDDSHVNIHFDPKRQIAHALIMTDWSCLENVQRGQTSQLDYLVMKR